VTADVEADLQVRLRQAGLKPRLYDYELRTKGVHQVLAIRMRRVGSKKRPFFRVVVAESTSAREGSFVEVLGHYYPRSKPAKVDINRERVQYWISRGARPSDTVRTLMARHQPTATTEPAVSTE
jgi:small subunit ribosomal protein S16